MSSSNHDLCTANIEQNDLKKREERVPINNHPSFNRPPVSTILWRYSDLPKFVDLLTSRTIWLANAEILARDDPYEGLPGAMQFPHRMWKKIELVPQNLRDKIVEIYGRGANGDAAEAFKKWFMIQEQSCIFQMYGRRQFLVNCWHASKHESAAMWKIYGTPGAGIALITNGARIEQALSSNSKSLYLGAINYVDPSVVQIGTSNSLDAIMSKRLSYAYEQEVRLVYWDTDSMHDPLEKFSWNDSTMQFDDIIEDKSPIKDGIALDCDVDTLIDRAIISPYAPTWYLPMIMRLRDHLSFQFPVSVSTLIQPPRIVD